MGYVPDAIIDRMRRSHKLGIFLHLATSPALRIWFGIHNIPAGFESVDGDGSVYQGGGMLVGVPLLEVLVNGASDNVDFTLSGLNPGLASTTLQTIPPVRGAALYMGITTLDDYYQPMSKIIPIWRGIASHISSSRPTVQGAVSPTTALSLSVVAGEATRSRPAYTLWSSAQQKILSPTDLFCDGTSRLARGVQPVWPNY
jgi:hypothetical protein